MIQSMTGYGKAELNLLNANFTIEVKSLNSKQIDTNVKMPSVYRDKEIGSFFTPITVKPLTIMGINYKFPDA